MATLGLSRLLPKPSQAYQVHKEEPSPATLQRLEITHKKAVPPYGKRGGFTPREPADFGDGGAFPEVHVAQFPLNMGKKDAAPSTAIVSVDVGADGTVNFDAIVKQGSNRNKIVHSKLSDLKGGEASEDLLAKPSAEEESEQAAKTKNALEALIGGKIAAARPVQHAKNPAMQESQYVRYTPNPNAPGFNPNAKQRVVELVEAQVDPMEPARHKHKKVPHGPPEDPVPVMHSPPRKVSVEDQEAWKIPPCISNWKNAKGYTIPLDKRLAADGRGLQEVTINPKFASLPQALYIAEDKAREQIAARAKINQKIKKLEREQKEQELRDLAARSRMARAGISAPAGGGGGGSGVHDRLAEEEEAFGEGGHYGRRPGGRGEEEGEENDRAARGGGARGGGVEGDMTEEERMAAQQREKLRLERRKELEREMRKDNMKGSLRKNKLDRDAERDVSEKIALGMHTGSAKLTGDEVYDSRLFNQGGGVATGFGDEEEYTVYSKALFDKGAGGSIYRPRGTGGLDEDGGGADGEEQYNKIANADKFRPDKGFAGADYGARQARDKPVQFEKAGDAAAASSSSSRRREGEGGGRRRGREEEEDFFGVGEFIGGGGGGDKRKDPLGHIGGGGRGMMTGSAAGTREELEMGSKRQKIGFTEAGSGRRRDRSRSR